MPKKNCLAGLFAVLAASECPPSIKTLSISFRNAKLAPEECLIGGLRVWSQRMEAVVNNKRVWDIYESTKKHKKPLNHQQHRDVRASITKLQFFSSAAPYSHPRSKSQLWATISLDLLVLVDDQVAASGLERSEWCGWLRRRLPSVQNPLEK